MPHHHIRDQWVSWQVYYNRHRHVLLCTLQFSVWYIAEAAVGGESKASGQAWSTMAAEQIFSHDLFTTFSWRLLSVSLWTEDCRAWCFANDLLVCYSCQAKESAEVQKQVCRKCQISVYSSCFIINRMWHQCFTQQWHCSMCSYVSFVLHIKPSEAAKIQWRFEAEARAEAKSSTKCQKTFGVA